MELIETIANTIVTPSLYFDWSPKRSSPEGKLDDSLEIENKNQ